jgi:hypothetical protein
MGVPYGHDMAEEALRGRSDSDISNIKKLNVILKLKKFVFQVINRSKNASNLIRES